MKNFLFVIILLSFALPSHGAEILSIKIPDSVTAENNFLVLGQIAEITGDANAAKKISNLRLSFQNEILRRADVVSAIQKSGVVGVQIELRMAEEVKVSKISQVKTSQNSPIIQKGQIVTLFANIGGILVESQGEAMQSGKQGERIRVRNISSKKVVTGIVRSPDRVEVAQ